MSEIASIFQSAQLGVEAVPGTLVPATKRLLATGFAPKMAGNVDLFTPQGMKYSTIASPGKEYAEFTVEGQASYTDMVYLLSSLVSYAAPVQQGATTAYKWTHASDAAGPDTVKTYSLERGSSERATKFAHLLMTGLTIEFDRASVKVRGTAFSRAASLGQALTPGTTAVEVVPIIGKQLTGYLDDAHDSLGNTKLTRLLKGSIEIGNRFSQLWVCDASLDSFLTFIETKPTVTVKLMLEADAEGEGYVDDLRAGATKFLRLKWEGATIADTYKYLFQLDSAVKFSELPPHGDQEGVYSLEFTGTAVYDGDWDKSYEFRVVNALSAL